MSAGSGLIVLPTVVSFSKTLAKLAIGLDKRPDLVASLTRREPNASSDETGERVTLVENTANTIREAFKKCLSERSGQTSGLTQDGKPEGRKIGIYVTANLCLKLFFHCKKLRSAEQIFGNIFQQSPPLALYPASQRVTYLYYLGRYHFANNHFFRAQLALQAAYNQCHAKYTKQKRLIIIYLITTNLFLGRLPASSLFDRHEYADISSKFQPLCEFVRKGDLASFRRYLDYESPSAGWFFHYRVLLQLQNRLEILVWRSLARRVFLLSGSQGGGETRVAPNLDLSDLLIVAISLERRALGLGKLTNGASPAEPRSRAPHTNSIFMTRHATNGATTMEEDSPPGYCDPDLAGVADDLPPYELPTMEIIESTVMSLVDQDLLHGFISHKSLRFAITGAKRAADPVQIGFPKVYDVIKAKMEEYGDEVPGWVKQGGTNKPTMGGQVKFGPGTVVNLSAARPVGMGAA